MARANNGIGRYDFSMNKLIQAETFYDSARYYNYMGRVYETMGDLNDKFGNYELAIQNLQESLSYIFEVIKIISDELYNIEKV